MQSNLTVKVGADLDGLRKELNKATGHLNGFSKQMSGVGSMIAGAFTLGAIVGVGKAIFETTAKFEKFNAVLTNTLGSSAAAQAVMQDITDFASKTPFQVDELTGSFVKLANQGFIPTMNEMTKLGDLAASQGKSFDQLTEAIIDAQTGEFERLKEFGVRASKQGDKVMFTFKGVQKQVDFTNDSIRDYVLSLGDAEGVSGGMKAISETLGGGVSNLSDAFDRLSVAIGYSANNGGIFNDILDGIAAAANKLTDTFRDSTTEEYLKATQQLLALRKKAAADGDIEKWAEYNSLIQQGTEKIREWYDGQKKLDELRNKGADTQTKKLETQKKKIEEITNAGQRLRFGLDSLVLPSNKVKGDDRDFITEMKAPNMSAFTQMPINMQKIGEQMRNAVIPINQAFMSIPKAIMDAAPILNQGLADMAFQIGEGIGNVIAGAGSISDLGPVLLGTLGGVLVQLGQMAIQTGLAIAGIKKALVSLNPVVAIAAGVALVALGSAVKAKASKIGSGGGGGGGGGSSVAPSNITRADNVANTMSIQLEGQWKIEGRDLVYALEKNTKLENKRKA